MAELLEMLFLLWTQVGPRKHYYVGCTLAWRHLANTSEPSVCGGDAAFCQITLTTCYYCYYATIAIFTYFYLFLLFTLYCYRSFSDMAPVLVRP